MHKWRAALVVAAALFLTLGSSPAYADIVGWYGGCGSATLTHITSPDVITLTNMAFTSGTSGCGLAGYTGAINVPGTVTITESGGGSIQLTGSGPQYSGNMNGATIAFTFADATHSLVGNVVLTTVSDGTTSPRFFGNLTVQSNNFGGVIGSEWPVNSNVVIDWTLNTPSTFTQLKSSINGTMTGAMSSGEVLPVPEPVTGFLFGGGMLVVGTFLRRRKK